MKKCNDCNVEMIEDTNLHTDYVGGYDFETRLYLTFDDEENGSKMLFSDKKISTKQVKARVCPTCGKVELYLDLEEK